MATPSGTRHSACRAHRTFTALVSYHEVVTIELNVLRTVSERLEAARLPFTVTGSMALDYYAAPRMTRDIDIVVALSPAALSPLQKALGDDFYFDADYALDAIRNERLFNLMHIASAMKIDLIVLKSSEYRQLEFSRRQAINVGGVPTWIVSREDLILSKLEWSKESASEMQRRDIVQLLAAPVDWEYLHHWGTALGVDSALQKLRP